MSAPPLQYDLLTQVLKYKNPFDIRDFLLSSKAYAPVYQDESFWRYMIKEVYDVDYMGDTPRTEFFRLYVKKNYTGDTKVKELPSKYHWLFYLRYFTGDNFNGGNFEVFTPERVKQPRPIGRKALNSEEGHRHRETWNILNQLDHMDKHTINNGASKGKTYIVANVQGKYMYVGDLNEISIDTLFSVHDPLDFPLWVLKENAENEAPIEIPIGNALVTKDTIVKYSLTNSDISYLGLKGYTSGYPDREGWYPQYILNFIQDELDEAKNFNIEEQLLELSFICNNVK